MTEIEAIQNFSGLVHAVKLHVGRCMLDAQRRLELRQFEAEHRNEAHFLCTRAHDESVIRKASLRERGQRDIERKLVGSDGDFHRAIYAWCVRNRELNIGVLGQCHVLGVRERDKVLRYKLCLLGHWASMDGRLIKRTNIEIRAGVAARDDGTKNGSRPINAVIKVEEMSYPDAGGHAHLFHFKGLLRSTGEVDGGDRDTPGKRLG